jgi:predicted enzyme related to lactoylglutathione lyase
MSTPDSRPGTIGWLDLTVGDAAQIRDFYGAVVGWKATGLDMGGYDDYVMTPDGGGDGVAGICHARGPNANLPPQWLVYIRVASIDEAVAKATELGGAVVDGPKGGGGQRFCVIRDPAGAHCALVGP